MNANQGSLFRPDAGEALRIISGGQTGGDQAGLRAARAAGLSTGGWAPRGWITMAGPAPWLADFGLRECPEPEGEQPPGMLTWQWEAACYVARTRRNARDAHLTIYFATEGDADGRGRTATFREALRAGNRILAVIKSDWDIEPADLVDLHGHLLHGTVNIAGNRESKSPGIGRWVEGYLGEVFRLIKGNS